MSKKNVWRYTAQETLFLYVFDARAALAFIPLAAHLRWSTFYFCLLVFVFFGLLARLGFTLPIFFRWCRAFLAGPHRQALAWSKRPQKKIKEYKDSC